MVFDFELAVMLRAEIAKQLSGYRAATAEYRFKKKCGPQFQVVDL